MKLSSLIKIPMEEYHRAETLGMESPFTDGMSCSSERIVRDMIHDHYFDKYHDVKDVIIASDRAIELIFNYEETHEIDQPSDYE